MLTLITGSTGFIGRRLVNKLQSQGSEIRVISRRPIPGIDSFISDLSDSNIPSEALNGVETVYHLAGYAHDLRTSKEKKDLYQSINVESTINLAKLAIKKKVKRFIFVSSVKAGGDSVLGQCVSEDDQYEPQGIYGKTKREAEIKLLELVNHKMHITILRPSLVYGPDLKGNLDLMLNGIKKGWFPPLPETGNRRSLVHVDDIVRALIFVSNDSRANGEIFNVTDGELYSSRQIYVAMCFVLNKSLPKWHIPLYIFKIASLANKDFKYKIKKLFGDECYSSKKIQSFGFYPKRSLKEMNETFY